MTSPPIGTDEELIERLRRIALTHYEERGDPSICRVAADALQSRISEVERLTALASELERELVPLRKLRDDPGWEVVRAALAQHRTTDE